MITKVYQYQLAPDSWERFLELQKKADRLYSKHISYEICFVRNAENPSKITEIHSYPNASVSEKAMILNEIEPELNQLFRDFLQMLDPTNNKIEEFTGETFQVRGQNPRGKS